MQFSEWKNTVQVSYKGSVENIIQDILGGMKITCTYIGASKLKNISKCATFVHVSKYFL